MLLSVLLPLTKWNMNTETRPQHPPFFIDKGDFLKLKPSLSIVSLAISFHGKNVSSLVPTGIPSR